MIDVYGFGYPVGIKDEIITDVELELMLLERIFKTIVSQESDRHTAGADELRFVGAQNKKRVMTRSGVAETARAEIQHAINQRDECAARRDIEKHLVEPRQNPKRRGFRPCQGLDDALDERHIKRGLDPLPAYIPDNHCYAILIEHDQVVIIAADLIRRQAHSIGIHARDLRHGARQKGHLHVPRNLDLAFEARSEERRVGKQSRHEW